MLLAFSLLLSGQFVYQEAGYNPIHTSVGYLQYAPDARSVGAGESGVASSPDLFSMFWNPAKFAFIEDRFGIAVSFSDYLWMKSMWNWNDDMSARTGFNTLHSFYRIAERSTLAFSFTYYNALDEITLIDEIGNTLGTYAPLDINLDAGYSFRFSNTFAGGLTARYIYSDFMKDQYINGVHIKAAQSVAFDLAVYYEKPVVLGSKDGKFSWGINLSNLGMKMSYFENDDGNPVVAAGMDPNVAVLKGRNFTGSPRTSPVRLSGISPDQSLHHHHHAFVDLLRPSQTHSGEVIEDS
jgi:hypothetical protein